MDAVPLLATGYLAHLALLPRLPLWATLAGVVAAVLLASLPLASLYRPGAVAAGGWWGPWVYAATLSAVGSAVACAVHRGRLRQLLLWRAMLYVAGVAAVTTTLLEAALTVLLVAVFAAVLSESAAPPPSPGDGGCEKATAALGGAWVHLFDFVAAWGLLAAAAVVAQFWADFEPTAAAVLLGAAMAAALYCAALWACWGVGVAGGWRETWPLVVPGPKGGGGVWVEGHFSGRLQ